MSVAFDVYEPGRGWLHRLDPRVKLLAVAVSSVALILVDALPAMVLATLLVHGLLLAAGVPSRRLLAVWRAIAPLLVLVVLLWPLFDRAGEPVLVRLGWFRITGDALSRGLAAAGRLAALTFLIFGWLATTSERALIRTFVRLGLPHAWGVALAIGLRSIPALAALYVAVSTAQQARGLRLDGPLLSRLQAQLPILVATVVTALRNADQMARVLDARAFGAPVRPTALHDLRMALFDWVALGLVLIAGPLIIWLVLVH